MNKYFIAFFMIVGIGDFFYGIFFKDQISVLVGAIILVLAIYVARRQRKSTKDEEAP
ncbi:MAG: hypothetical protein JRC60_06680 [Deltaproteobacteria bacterium]|nr:hypothetical protein [Deltaproteobacteria bacterium]